MSGAALEIRTREVMAQVGLTDAADRRVATYSGGMRQRLGIAQALVNRPSVLILDEPVSSLDPEGRRDLLALIAELRDTSTVLFSTHVLADVERVCDRVGILDRGRLVTEGPLTELLDRHALPIYRVDPEPDQAQAVGRLVEALRTADWTTDVTTEHGTVRVTVRDPGRASRELLPAIVAAGLAVAGVERVRPTLEDVFLHLTGDGVGTDGREDVA
jgi:ABC-2 type transport system ATP-binding protein